MNFCIVLLKLDSFCVDFSCPSILFGVLVWTSGIYWSFHSGLHCFAEIGHFLRGLLLPFYSGWSCRSGLLEFIGVLILNFWNQLEFSFWTSGICWSALIGLSWYCSLEFSVDFLIVAAGKLESFCLDCSCTSVISGGFWCRGDILSIFNSGCVLLLLLFFDYTCGDSTGLLVARRHFVNYWTHLSSQFRDIDFYCLCFCCKFSSANRLFPQHKQVVQFC